MAENAERAPELFTTDDSAMTHAMEGGHTEQAEPLAAFGLEAFQWVSVAMLVFVAILVWKGVPKLISGGLDGKIAEIKAQLDEAKALRAEAEALRDDYAAKIAGAEKDAAAMLDHARAEAEAIVKKAEADTKAVIARREKMAKDKIAAAERAAIEELRAKVADVAAVAARGLIARKHDAGADKALVDDVISTI